MSEFPSMHRRSEPQAAALNGHNVTKSVDGVHQRTCSTAGLNAVWQGLQRQEVPLYATVSSRSWFGEKAHASTSLSACILLGDDLLPGSHSWTSRPAAAAIFSPSGCHDTQKTPVSELRRSSRMVSCHRHSCTSPLAPPSNPTATTLASFGRNANDVTAAAPVCSGEPTTSPWTGSQTRTTPSLSPDATIHLCSSQGHAQHLTAVL